MCDSAKLALDQADAAIAAAKEMRALWTTALEAQQTAKELFGRGDYVGAQRAAGVAAEQAQLGMAQKRYPILPVPPP
jgi:hypothetical protein